MIEIVEEGEYLSASIFPVGNLGRWEEHEKAVEREKDGV
jgi:hypothetical protein